MNIKINSVLAIAALIITGCSAQSGALPTLQPLPLEPDWTVDDQIGIGDVCIVADGKIAAASLVGSVCILDGQRGNTVDEFTPFPQGTFKISYAPQANVIASRGRDGTSIHIHSCQENGGEITVQNLMFRHFGISQDAAIIAVVPFGENSAVTVVDMLTQKRTQVSPQQIPNEQQPEFTDSWHVLKLNSDGSQLFIGHPAGVFLYDISSQRKLFSLIRSKEQRSLKVFTSDDNCEFGLIWHDQLEVVDFKSGKVIATAKVPNIPERDPTGISLAPYRPFRLLPQKGLAIGTVRRRVQTPLYALVWKYTQPTKFTFAKVSDFFDYNACDISADGRFLGIASTDGSKVSKFDLTPLISSVGDTSH